MPKLLEIIISLGIHLEGEDDSVLRLEYDPNRPDFSSDYGIARAVKGKLGIEVGAPKHKLRPAAIQVLVDRSVQNVRPFIALGFSSPMTIEHLLESTDVGRKYGGLVKGHDYPILKDSNETVLSVPPIINGTATEVKSGVRNLFVDVTGTERRLVEDALAIISEALADAGGDLEKVSVRQGDEVLATPNLNPRKVKLKINEVKNLLGLNLTATEIVDSLRKVR